MKNIRVILLLFFSLSYTLIMAQSTVKKEKNGKIVEQYQLVNNKKEGEYFKYFSNGNIKIRSFYNAGKLNGNYQRWNQEGKLLKEGRFFGGLKDGLWTEWWSNGKKKAEFSYSLGELTSVPTFWKSDGTEDDLSSIIYLSEFFEEELEQQREEMFDYELFE